MEAPSSKAIIRALLERHRGTFSEEIGIRIEKETPAVLFQWLCASILFSTEVSADIAAKAARSLLDHGLTLPAKMAAAPWETRTRILNQAGYARYDERTSAMLGETAQFLLDKHQGDLRKLRRKAGRRVSEERRLLKEFKGMGDTGVDIFFREVQSVWPEVMPFADSKALSCAGKLGLPEEAKALRRLVAERYFVPLLSALVRCDLQKDHKAILRAAAEEMGK
jgi:hypothetical protein